MKNTEYDEKNSLFLFFRWESLCKAIPLHAIPRSSAQFREYLIASLFAITAQFRAIKWRKRKHDHCAQLHAIPRTEFRLETLTTTTALFINSLDLKGPFTCLGFFMVN